MSEHEVRHEDVLDTAHRTLSNRTCRLIVRTLANEADAVTIEELAAQLRAPDAGTAGKGEDDLAIQLYHRHLPRLDDAGVIRYHTDERIGLSDRGETVEAVRRAAEDVLDDRPVG